MALLNKPRDDLRRLKRSAKKQYKEITAEMGVSHQRVAQIYGTQVVNHRFLDLCELLGYDVQLVYIKRKEHPDYQNGLLWKTE